MQNDLLDLVIGVVFVWFLLSMLASAISEGIALALRVRAKYLWVGIGHLIDPTAERLWRQFRSVGFPIGGDNAKDRRPSVTKPGTRHGAAAGGTDSDLQAKLDLLYDNMAPALVEVGRTTNRTKVTRIASGLFADALLTVAKPVFKDDLVRAAGSEPGWDATKSERLKTRLKDLDASVALDVATLWADGTGWDNLATEAEVEALFTAAQAMVTVADVELFVTKNQPLAAAVRRAVHGVAASDQIQTVKTTIESWYDREMEQITAIYRRQNRKILLLLSIPIVLAFQANAVGLALNLHHDADLRQALVTEANNVTSQDKIDAVCSPTTTSTTTTTEPGSDAPDETTTTAPPDDTTTTTSTTTPLDGAVERYECATRIVDLATRFQVGLGYQALETAHERSIAEEVPTDDDAESEEEGEDGDEAADADLALNDVWPYLTEDWGWIGMPLTMLALTFGAQFWLQALRRLIDLRKMVGSGPNA